MLNNHNSFTLRMLIDCFLKEKVGKVTEGTLASYKYHLNLFLTGSFSKQKTCLGDFTVNDLKLHLDDLKSINLSVSTIDSHYSIIKNLFDWAVGFGVLERSPFVKCRHAYSYKRNFPQTINKSELNFLSKVLKYEMDKSLRSFELKKWALFALCLCCGLKSASILNLRPDNVQLNKSNLFIEHKSRIIDIPKFLQPVLRKYLANINGTSQEYLFQNEKGGKLNRSHAYHLIAEILLLINSKERGIRILRNTYFSALINQNDISVRELSIYTNRSSDSLIKFDKKFGIEFLLRNHNLHPKS